MALNLQRDNRLSIGFVIDQLRPNQICYELIKNINQFSEENIKTDFIIYTEEINLPYLKPLFPILSASDMLSHDGPLIATDIHTAFLVNSVISKFKKYYFLTDLHFLRNNVPPNILDFLFKENRFSLITRSKLHYDIVKSLIGEESWYLNKDFSIEEIQSRLWEENLIQI